MYIPEKWNHLNIVDQIGFGSYGAVYEAEDINTGDVYAIKIIKIPSDNTSSSHAKRIHGENAKEYFYSIAKSFNSEIDLLKELNAHKNIVTILDHILEPDKDGIGWNIYIQMELLEDLTAINFDEEKTIQLGLDICTALEECEKRNIIHRDIKPDNILISEDGSFKLTDFGNAKRIEKTERNSIKGTFSFMAPELYNGSSYNNQVDIYSLGLVMYLLMNHGRKPFMDLEKDVVYFEDEEQSLTRRMNGERLPDPVDASAELSDILRKACAYSTDKRYRTASEMKADLWSLKLGTYKIRHGKYKKRDRRYDEKRIIQRTGILTSLSVLGILALLFGAYKGINSLQYTRLDISSRINGNGVLLTDGSESISEISALDHSVKNKITKVVITEPITTVQADMFADCPDLEEISLPDSVVEISEHAFEGCSSLKTVVLPENLESIGKGAFTNCQSLERIHIPEGIATLPQELFKGCSSLQSVSGNENLSSIESSAFYGCSHLKEISLPETVNSIGNSAFYNCDSMKELHLPDQIQTIEAYTFFSCDTLTNVTLPENLLWISENAFGQCHSLTKLSIPDSVLKIDPTAFEGCDHLTTTDSPK